MKQNRHLKFLGFLGALLLSTSAWSQLTVVSGVSASQLIQSMVGNGLTVSNVVINCDTSSYATFNNGSTTNLGMNSGILLTSGTASGVAGPGANFTSGSLNTTYIDPDLYNLNPDDVNDVCVVEFDILPTCDSLTIRYVFGSEEYPVFVNSFNDGFGFFITGLNPAGGSYTGTNVATLPSGQFVSINNVNNGNSNTGPCVNCAYYVDNSSGATITYNGLTTVLTSRIGLVPCTSYHFKIAIADALDWSYDSGVFVDLMSCSTAFQTTTANTPDVCNACNGSATVNVTGGQPPYTYQWLPSGGTSPTATNLCAGTYSVVVWDVSACGVPDTVVVNVPSQGAIALTAQTTSVACIGDCNGSITVSNNGGIPPFTYSWTPNVSSSNVAGNLCAGTYSVTMVDGGGCTSSASYTLTQPTQLAVSMASTLTNCNDSTGTVTASPTGGTGPYTYLWNDGQTTQTATGLWVGTDSVLVTDSHGCTQTQFASVIMALPPSAVITAVPPSFVLGGSSLLATDSSGTTYVWSPPTDLSCNNCPSPVASPQQTTTYCVVVSDSITGCVDSSCVRIDVELPCSSGGLDKLLPNAFSPNGDGTNDAFCIPYNICISTFELKIYDRWGEKVFETNSMTNCWDGTYKGEMLNRGLYVYYLDAVLSTGDEYHRSGNISLIK